jgi:chromosome condensin MukBEF ATPase and DNA-binding subunit MukB
MTELVDVHAHLKAMIERRNKYFVQRNGLQARVDKLDAKINAMDEEIWEEDRRVNGPR